jgi:hypothetical protein
LRFDVLDNVNGSQGQAFEVDYIKIDAIPEPATVGMLGLGALLLLLVRRIQR